MKLEITTPGKLVYSGEAELVLIPGEEGEFGVLEGHAAVISNLKTGIIEIHPANSDNSSEAEVTKIIVEGGLAEVNPDECSVLATKTHNPEDLVVEDIQKAINEAEAEKNTAESEFDIKMADETIDLNNKILALIK